MSNIGEDECKNDQIAASRELRVMKNVEFGSVTRARADFDFDI